MPAQTLNQIEWQFAHLTPPEQLSLLERLVHQVRVGADDGNSSRLIPSEMKATAPKIHREVDRMESRSAEADLLSEVW